MLILLYDLGHCMRALLSDNLLARRTASLAMGRWGSRSRSGRSNVVLPGAGEDRGEEADE